MIRYDVVSLLDDILMIDGISHKVKLGKHCIWVPDIETKFVLSLHGQVESVAWRNGKNANKILKHDFIPKDKVFQLNSIIMEHHVIELLSQDKMMPVVGEYVFAKSFISSIFYPYYCDCYGIWGYKMADANRLPKGEWNFEIFKTKYIDGGIIEATPGALGDLKKADNMVNGYLVDIRRTEWDMIKLKG